MSNNVERTIRVTSSQKTRVFFLDDEGCYRLLHAYKDAEWPWLGAILARRFLDEKDGRFKSDLCRLAQLHKHGGYYFDNDIFVLVDLSDGRHIHRNTTFATSVNENRHGELLPYSHRERNAPSESFFQACVCISMYRCACA